MTSDAVLDDRDLVPVNTILKTVINDSTVKLVIYKSLVTRVSVNTLGFLEMLSNVKAGISASSAAAASAFVETVVANPNATPTVGRIAPELVPIAPLITPTPTTFTTATTSSESLITAKPSPPHSGDGNVNVNVSNTLSPGGSGTISPIVIIGIVFGIVVGLAITTVLFLLLRRRRTKRKTRHQRNASTRTAPPIPLMAIPRPAAPPSESSSEYPWPKASIPAPRELSNPAPRELFEVGEDEQDEVPHQQSKRPRLSGETFTEEERVGRAGHVI